MNDWQAGLQAFLDSNPDLPQGEKSTPIAEEKTSTKQPRLDIILEKKGRGGKIATIVTGFTISDDEVAELAQKENAVGFLLPGMEKHQLFRGVISGGVLPRKTFSMGHAREKRYYLEGRKIK